MTNLATDSDFSVQLQSASCSNCSTKISEVAINSQPALFILPLTFLVLFLVYDTEKYHLIKHVCCIPVNGFQHNFVKSGCWPVFALFGHHLEFYLTYSNISCLPLQNRWTVSLQEYILTSLICFGSFHCKMGRTGSVLVKLVYFVLHIREYEARLNALIWRAGPLTAIL